MSTPQRTRPKEPTVAFWRYDTFPHVLCDEVESFIGEDGVVPKNYGGHAFIYFTTLPLKEGLEVKAKLEELRAEYRQAEEKLKRSFRQRRIDIMPTTPKEFAEKVQRFADHFTQHATEAEIGEFLRKGGSEFYNHVIAPPMGLPPDPKSSVE